MHLKSQGVGSNHYRNKNKDPENLLPSYSFFRKAYLFVCLSPIKCCTKLNLYIIPTTALH